jgi:hypothetical protein
LAQAQGRLEGLGQPLAQVRPHFETIDDGFDGVLAAHIELRRLIEFDHLAVNAGADEAAGLEFFEQLRVLALALGNGGR